MVAVAYRVHGMPEAVVLEGKQLAVPCEVRERRHLEGFEHAGDAVEDARLEDGRWTVQGDPTEGALVVAAMKAGVDIGALKKKLPRTAELPFTSESKRMTTLHRGPDGTRAYVKGAAEVVLRDCSHLAGEGGDAPLDERGRDRFTEAAEAILRMPCASLR